MTPQSKTAEESPYPEFEFRPEKRRWLFWLARIFGRKVACCGYYWRGKLWIVE